ncbi:patatin-like phospholipase family protein [Ideonella sp.]|jgi:NTE family protein|uniref:patatin-like phospholipase family protein n=1 Tax=Ideonella sp. TaxID=1929293 RepID=UPI0037C14985
MKKLLLPLLGLAATLGWPQAWAQPVAAATEARPKTCLVLSGGGARGFTHVGVIKVLERLRVPIDCVVGTSMGSIVGGLYASGMSGADIEAAFLKTDWSALGSERVDRSRLGVTRRADDYTFPLGLEMGLSADGLSLPSGVVSGGKFEQLLQTLTAHVPESIHFDVLPLPFRTVATDLESGQEVVIQEGNLYEAIRASMSVPGLFSPIELNGRLMADGGLVKNLPVDVARRLGAQRIIAVNIGTPLTPRKELRSLLSVSQQMINILTEQNVTAQKAMLGPQDVLISPDLAGFSFLDFARVTEVVRIGEEATRPLETRLAAMAVPAEQYAQWRQSQARLAREPAPTEFVAVSPLTVVPPQAVLEAAGLKVGESASAADIQAAIGRVQEMGDFERVSVRTLRKGDEFGVMIDAKEKFWGPNYLRLGLDASIDLAGEGSISFRLGHLRTWVNGAGAQWRNRLDLGRVNGLSTEIFQPFWLNSPVFASAGAGVLSYKKALYDQGRPVLTGDVKEHRATVELGAELSKQSEIRIGASRKVYRATGNLSILTPERGIFVQDLVLSFAENDIYARYLTDSLDNAFLPSSGQRLMLQVGRNQGSDEAAATKMELRWTGAYTSGNHTWWPAVRLAKTRAPIGQGAGAFDLGGFLELSGLPTESLSGSRLGFVRMAYLNRVSTLDLFGRRLLLGGSLELGNAWDTRPQRGYAKDLLTAGSLFAAAETPIGPLFFGLGRTAGRNTAVYLFLGQP